MILKKPYKTTDEFYAAVEELIASLRTAGELRSEPHQNATMVQQSGCTCQKVPRLFPTGLFALQVIQVLCALRNI